MNAENYILYAKDTALIVIDIQERLFPAMEEARKATLVKNACILIESARVLGMPVVASEQYRKGLGDTLPEIKSKLEGIDLLEKMHFDCMRDDALRGRITGCGRKNMLIAGIESHVCVFQTALSVMSVGMNAVVVSDAVASRRAHDRSTAMKALVHAGAIVYPTETAVFMLMEKAGTPEFKKLAPLFK